MTTTPLRTAALACAALVLLTAGASQATAASVNVGIRVGSPPPPPPQAVYRPWAKPHRSAVWIPGHQEWRGGRWVWIGGYYDYPPRRGGYWVPGNYHHGYYRPGHWAY